jgi:hypothetical protein
MYQRVDAGVQYTTLAENYSYVRTPAAWKHKEIDSYIPNKEKESNQAYTISYTIPLYL